MKIKIEVFSHYLFDEHCKKDGLNDKNVENEKDKAVIDIIGTEECRKYYLKENMRHYFNEHPNVINFDFDDIGDDVIYNGHHFKTLSMADSEKAIQFIETMINNGVTYFRICCRAGMSRSRAFAEFIYRYCQEHNIDIEYEDRNDYTTILNQGVLKRLNHAYWKKHKINCYANGEDYEDELVHPEIRVIDLYGEE